MENVINKNIKSTKRYKKKKKKTNEETEMKSTHCEIWKKALRGFFVNVILTWIFYLMLLTIIYKLMALRVVEGFHVLL